MADAFEIVSGKGANLMVADLLDIETALLDAPVADHWAARATVMSAIELLIANPDYSGDITLEDIADPAD